MLTITFRLWLLCWFARQMGFRLLMSAEEASGSVSRRGLLFATDADVAEAMAHQYSVQCEILRNDCERSQKVRAREVRH